MFVREVCPEKSDVEVGGFRGGNGRKSGCHASETRR